MLYDQQAAAAFRDERIDTTTMSPEDVAAYLRPYLAS